MIQNINSLENNAKYIYIGNNKFVKIQFDRQMAEKLANGIKEIKVNAG